MPKMRRDLVQRTLRLPRTLNTMVEAIAQQRGVSANHLIVEAVWEHLPRRGVTVSDAELEALIRETDDLIAKEQTGMTPTLARIIERSYGA